MKKTTKNDCRALGAKQLEVALIDLHIRQLQAAIREQQAVVKQLKMQRDAITASHKKKRRRKPYDADTPLIKLVNLQQLEQFKTMIDKWEMLTTETIHLSKTSQFHFKTDKLSQAILALARAIQHEPPVFKVSILQVCSYLAEHSNLGNTASIRQALYRRLKEL